jgi:hypothetical protein
VARSLLFPPRGEALHIATALACLSTLALGLGCASAPLPTQQLGQAQGAIRAADETGASRHPRANLHLKMARDQVRAAETLIREEEMLEAKVLLERAEADAELALALAREARLRTEARDAISRVRELQQRAGTE